MLLYVTMYNYGYWTTTYLLHYNKEYITNIFFTDIEGFLQSPIYFATIKVETYLSLTTPGNETIWCSIKGVIIWPIITEWHRSDQWASGALRSVSWCWYVSAYPTRLLPSKSSVLLSINKIKHSQKVMLVILVKNIINVRISVVKPLFQ